MTTDQRIWTWLKIWSICFFINNLSLQSKDFASVIEFLSELSVFHSHNYRFIERSNWTIGFNSTLSFVSDILALNRCTAWTGQAEDNSAVRLIMYDLKRFDISMELTFVWQFPRQGMFWWRRVSCQCNLIYPKRETLSQKGKKIVKCQYCPVFNVYPQVKVNPDM